MSFAYVWAKTSDALSSSRQFGEELRSDEIPALFVVRDVGGSPKADRYTGAMKYPALKAWLEQEAKLAAATRKTSDGAAKRADAGAKAAKAKASASSPMLAKSSTDACR